MPAKSNNDPLRYRRLSNWRRFTTQMGESIRGVTAPALVNGLVDQSLNWGVALSYQFASNSFSGSPITYTATKSDNSPLPSWLTFTGSTRTFSGVPDASDAGTLSVKVTATNSGGTATDTFDVVVTTAAFPDGKLYAGHFFLHEIVAVDLATGSEATLLNNASGGPYMLAYDYLNDRMLYTELGDLNSLHAVILGATSAGVESQIVYDAGGRHTTGVQIDPIEQKIYFSGTVADVGGGGGNIFRTAMDGSGFASVISVAGTGRIYNFRIDLTNSKIYYTNRFGKEIRRCTLAGGSDTLLVSTNGEPYGLALDLYNGKIYWSEIGTSIQYAIKRSDLDGSNVTNIVANGATVLGTVMNQPLYVELDVPAGFMYWSDSLNYRIIKCNLDGSSPSLLYTMPVPGMGTNADPHGFYLKSTSSVPTLANPIADQSAAGGVPFSYQFPSNTFAGVDGSDTLVYFATSPTGGAIAGWLSFNASTRTLSGNPSGVIDSTTVRITAVSLRSNRTAYDTFDINISAPVVTEFPANALYGGTSDLTQLLGIDLTSGTGSNTYFNSAAVRDLCINAAHTIIYFTDTTRVQKLSYDGTHSVLATPTSPDGTGVTGIALDEANGNLYYGVSSATNDGIFRVTTSGTGNTQIVASASVNNPTGLALDLPNSRIYFIDRGGKKICRCPLTGGTVTDILTGRTGTPWFIALDLTNSLMYWTERSPNKVYRATLAGGSVTDVTPAPALAISFPLGIALNVSGNKMYVSDNDNKRIIQSTLTGTSPVVFGPSTIDVWGVRLVP